MSPRYKLKYTDKQKSFITRVFYRILILFSYFEGNLLYIRYYFGFLWWTWQNCGTAGLAVSCGQSQLIYISNLTAPPTGSLTAMHSDMLP